MPYENETEQDVLARARAWRARRLGFVMRYLFATGWWGDRIRFTVAPTGDRKLTLQDFTAPINAVVHWGDGTRDALTQNAPLSHTYADEKPRTVTISGQLGGFWNRDGYSARDADGSSFVTSLDEVSSQSLVSLSGTFSSCTSLKKIPATLDAPNLKNFDLAFYGCGSIEGALPAYWLTHPRAEHWRTFEKCAATVASTMEGGIMRCTWLKYPLETTTLYQYATATGMWLAQECCPSGTRSLNGVICRASGTQTSCAQAACPWPLSTSSQATPCTNPKNTEEWKTCPHFYGNSACRVPVIDTVYAEAQKAGWA